MGEENVLMILSPFEIPDIQLVLDAIKSGAFGVLSLGENSEEAKKLIEKLSKKTQESFGICISEGTVLNFDLPVNVTKIILPFGCDLKRKGQADLLYQVRSIHEAEEAIAQKVSSIIIKGNEGAGRVAESSSFDIFRKVIDASLQNNVEVYIQGGAGIHTSAAFLAMGARGIIFDSQIALFPECTVSRELKSMLQKVEENDLKEVDHFRMLDSHAALQAVSRDRLAVGRDILLAAEWAERYKRLRSFVAAVYEAAYGHLRQAKKQELSYFNADDFAANSNKEEAQTTPNSDLICWEKQIVQMLQKERNLSKFRLSFSNELPDAFFSAFAAIMSAPVRAKGIAVGIDVRNAEIAEKEQGPNNLPSDTQKLLTGLKDIPPFCPVAHPSDIAVVGMDCVYPGAANVDEYWKNILLAKDCITEIPASYWDKDALYKANTTDTDYSMSKWGGFIPPTDFDPLEFGIVPQSLFMTEPSHLLSLLVVKRALKDAGYAHPAECDFENTSIFFGGNSTSNPLVSRMNARFRVKQALVDLPEDLKDAFPKANEYSFPGILSNLLTGRVANRLNFGGRNYTVDAACASSLASLDVACQELSTFRADMAVYGGADLTNTFGPYLMFSSMRVLSSKGYCAPFDADADGIVLGEGVGAVVLKRLEDAERDGNKIYAVIKGMGGSSDGRNLSVTAPSRKGECKAMERAYQSAGILPAQVGMIEAHGTGTVVGDRVELASLTDVFFESGALPKQTFIGSVKSQIGHTKCAAGVAGIIKAVLSVRHGIIPPTIHLDKLNAFYDPKTSPFVFNKRAGLWSGEKRIAGVSAFGFGGTNFHAVIENYLPNASAAAVFESWPSELFVFRGSMLNEAKILMGKVKKLLMLNDTVRLSDIAYSLALYSDKDIQVSIVAGNAKELLAKIEAAMADRIELKIYRRKVMEGKVAFLFSGQGSQYVNMARDLFVAFPLMRRLLDKHSEYIRILFPEAAFDEATKEAQEKAMTDTNNAQPLLGIVDLAIAEYLRFLGIHPDMVAGHSYGELPALCFAGVIAPDDLVALSEARACAIRQAIGEDKGKLVAAIVSKEELQPLLEGETEVWAVNYNSPKQIVLGGTTQGIELFMKKAANRNIICTEINVDCAFHSPLVEEAEKLYADVLKKYTFQSPKMPVWANTTTGIYPQATEKIKMLVAKHLAQPIEFTRQIENMYDAGACIFIETGPGRILLGLVETILGKKAATIQTESKSSEGVTYLLRALGQYLSLGKSFAIEKLFEGRNVSFLCLDDPDQYRKSPTNWLIDGSEAYPDGDGKLVNKERIPQKELTYR
ncbi:MAG: acyltransferase domain-containing protein [Candidatus Azobacteroides sp.]|nr:acyltransferase domain-containing protein [Candidatus Azobacteroides sp.]